MLICQEKPVEKKTVTAVNGLKTWEICAASNTGSMFSSFCIFIYKAEAFFAYFLNALAIFPWWALLPKDLQRDQKVHGCRLCTTFGPFIQIGWLKGTDVV